MILFTCLPEKAEVACKRNHSPLFLLKRLCDLWLKKIPRKRGVPARRGWSCSASLRAGGLELPHAWLPSGEFPHQNRGQAETRSTNQLTVAGRIVVRKRGWMHARSLWILWVFAEKVICKGLCESLCYSTK